MRKIQFFDTTLRDGEQTPGVNFDTKEKVQIAKQLERWGIDVIEAGFPIASQGDFEAVKAIAETVTNMTVAGLARCRKPDIDRVTEALVDAKDPQIHVFLATSPIHMEEKLHMTEDEVLASIDEHVRYARERFEKVQFSPEDATRSEKAFLLKAVQTAVRAGATIINIPDTVGYSNPTEYGALIRFLIDGVDDPSIIFSSHCHDDLGMAAANALAAIEAGANRVEGTINGIGERAGNTPLEEIALSLATRKDFYQAESQITFKETKRTSDLVARLSGVSVPRNKAIVGANAFAHESGIHQDGVLKNPGTYEIITPAFVGVANNSLPLGKLSGRHAFAEKMKDLGFNFSDEELQPIFKKFKDLADKKKEINDDDLLALVASRKAVPCRLTGLRVSYSLEGVEAAVTITENEESFSETVQGSGSIQAIYQAIDQLLPTTIILEDYQIKSITAGEDAQAEVYVALIDQEGRIVHGTGIDFDVLHASAKAYLEAKSRVKSRGENK